MLETEPPTSVTAPATAAILLFGGDCGLGGVEMGGEVAGEGKDPGGVGAPGGSPGVGIIDPGGVSGGTEVPIDTTGVLT